MKEIGPYILVENDNDWYVIPKAREAEFDKWTQLDGDDESSWRDPPYAERVGGCPSLVEFPTYLVR